MPEWTADGAGDARIVRAAGTEAELDLGFAGLHPSLPRDEFGHPYQPLFWFDEASRPIGLIVDGDDRVLAWENNAKGNPDILASPTCQRLPDIVEAAARQWWSNQVAPPLPG